jgi:hypothetical protein
MEYVKKNVQQVWISPQMLCTPQGIPVHRFWNLKTFGAFRRFRKVAKDRLFALSWLSVRHSARNKLTHTERILIKFDILVFF